MISFSFHIRNPFPIPSNHFENIVCKTTKISKNKFFEYEWIYSNFNWVTFELDLNWFGTDHAGPRMRLGVAGYEYSFTIYDQRHWNTVEQRWWLPGEEPE